MLRMLYLIPYFAVYFYKLYYNVITSINVNK